MARVHQAECSNIPRAEANRLTKNTRFGKSLLSIKDLTLEEIKFIIEVAAKFKTNPPAPLINNKIIAHCFFEPSTRTRLSFETATLKLGGKVIGFGSEEGVSTKKGETLSDTMRVIAEYADLIVIRHPREGAARLAHEVSLKPVINAGDGANQHPTQALMDWFTITESQQSTENLSIAFVGDLKYGRTIHSLVLLAMLFKVRCFFVAPIDLHLPEYITNDLKAAGIRFSFHQSISEVIPKVDILYMSRMQKERFQGTYTSLSQDFILTERALTNARDNLKILHPLPRLQEIEPTVDKMPYAHYFAQAANGVWVRQALLALALNENLN